MGLNEARLRAMLERNPDSAWTLNDEDRSSIQWAFDRIQTLEEDLKRSRQDWINLCGHSNRVRERMREIAALCQMEIL